MILNSLALVFVLELDELSFQYFLTYEQKQQFAKYSPSITAASLSEWHVFFERHFLILFRVLACAAVSWCTLVIFCGDFAYK